MSFQIVGYCSTNSSTNRLGWQSLAPASERSSDWVHQFYRRHDVPQSSKVLPDERKKVLDRFSHRPRRHISLVRQFSNFLQIKLMHGNPWFMLRLSRPTCYNRLRPTLYTCSVHGTNVPTTKSASNYLNIYLVCTKVWQMKDFTLPSSQGDAKLTSNSFKLNPINIRVLSSLNFISVIGNVWFSVR